MNTSAFALSPSVQSDSRKIVGSYATQKSKQNNYSHLQMICGHESGNRIGNNKEIDPSASNDPIANKFNESHQRTSVSSNASMMNNLKQMESIRFKIKPLRQIMICLAGLIHKALEKGFVLSKEEKVNEIEMLINEICGGQEFIYRKQQEIDVLCKKTSFTRKEIKLLYWGWKVACPEGVLNEVIFKEIYSQFFPQAGDASLYARFVFQAMFADSLAKNEPITFTEYAKALSLLCRGTIEDKIDWMFTLYDINRDGKITYDEVFRISVAIYALLGFHVIPSHNLRTYEEHARQVFAGLDPNSNGFVTLEQFKEICLKNETVLTSMEQLNIDHI
ncbi:Kv channel-interacting protein 4 [Sarcoptes scabiei]|uniref:Kv channel-interacting protein 4 n=1 Tax=Sarcoptes scabiei TaxID=52283 RepID=A0A834V9W1_SARSC|nr:Kv channel-interacting protein 4 [Sarcoptes scabiei]